MKRTKETWLQGERIKYQRDATCCGCRTPYELLHHADGPGDICLDCWLGKPVCSTDGCEGIVVERGLCRDCYMDDNGEVWEQPGHSAISEFQNVESWFFSRDLVKKPKEEHVKPRDNPFRMR